MEMHPLPLPERQHSGLESITSVAALQCDISARLTAATGQNMGLRGVDVGRGPMHNDRDLHGLAVTKS
jgi:hypothetical protein